MTPPTAQQSRPHPMGNRPTVSVAMTTYNGETHLIEQLESLANQMMLPDELVISDDASKDTTIKLIEEFSKNAPFKVTVEAGKENIGFHKNFERAVGMTAGDLIFPCDHDDVWLPEKIERTVAVFAERPRVGVVLCDARVVGRGLEPKGFDVSDTVGFDAPSRDIFSAGRGFDVLLRHSFVAGPTMAFRSKYLRLAMPVGEGWFPDAWVALVVSAVSETALIDEPMYLYRQHGVQLAGLKRKGVWQKYVEAKRRVDSSMFARIARHHRGLFDRIQKYEGSWDSSLAKDEVLQQVSEKLRFCEARSRLRSGILKRWPLVALGLARGDYHRLGHGWKTVALDLFI